jgi:thiol-disulfide isomerase/thioredoxin
MMEAFGDYIKVFKAEWLKLRNSGMFWLIIIMAAFIPAIFTLVGFLVDDPDFVSVNTVNPWKQLVSNCFGGFGSFFYPVFLTLVIVRLTQMEHRGGGWKLIETQPVSKASLYLGKFSISIVIAFFCIAALILFALAGGTLLMLVKDNSPYSGQNIPFGSIAALGFRTLIAGFGILAIQYLFSVVISGFIGPFAIGLAATIAGNILSGFGKFSWWPYLLTSSTVSNPDGGQTGNFLMHYEWLSIAWMFIGLWLGYQWFQRRTFKRAFLKPYSRLLYVIIPAMLFSVLFIFISKPVQLASHNRTVIAGRLDTKEPISRAYLFAEPFLDTVLEIPVQHNEFHFTTEKNIPAGIYYFKAGNMAADQVFFGNKDSLFLEIKSDGKSKKTIIKGTRIAEHSFLKNPGYSFDFSYLSDYGYEMKPEVFARKAVNAWKQEIGKINDYKTADNLVPAKDFIEIRKKLITMKYLNLLDLRYAKWYRVYHPNETLQFPKSIEQLRGAASYTDSTLLGFELFREKLSEYYEQKYKLSLSNDTVYINKLCSLVSSGSIRDFLIYDKLKDLASRTTDSVKREQLLNTYLSRITRPNIHRQLIAQHALLKSLNRGKEAPDFISVALNKDTISLIDFKGRYVVIDVWATWCAPCKIQSPVFERIAEQYTDPSVAFVSLSIDHNKWAWQNEASEKSYGVLQLFANDKDELAKAYGIEYIPRFVLIGPDGKIINAMMPQPTDQMFEEILRQEIPGLKSM